MRIAIDARLNAYRQGGIPEYTRQLLSALADSAPEVQFLSLEHVKQKRPLMSQPNVRPYRLWTPPHHRFERWTLPLEVWPTRADLLHLPDFVAPPGLPCAAVVTIHDLAFLRFPEILTKEASAYYSQVGASIRRSQGVIADSEATKRDLVELLGVAPERVDVIYLAADPLFRRVEAHPREVRRIGAAGEVQVDQFLLFVSTIEPRKNLTTLLQALRVCLDRHPDRAYRLVVVGARGWRDDSIFGLIRDLRLHDSVSFTGGISVQDLRWLYSTCRFYCNPSLYEGFGLPLLEALACGAACLASDTSSLPEVGGDAVRYVPPRDVAAWADAITLFWEDAELRRELGQRGQARALRFSWLDTARATMAVYRRAIQQFGTKA